MIHTPALLDVSLHKRSDDKNSHRNLSLHQGYRLYLPGNFRTDLCITHITCHNRCIPLYFLITYGVCKKRKYCNRMSGKKILSFWWMLMFCMIIRQNKRKKISVRPSVCLSVCLSGCTWTFALDTITFEGVCGSKQNLVGVFYVWNVGLVLKSKVKSLSWSWSWTDFDFQKNFAERH